MNTAGTTTARGYGWKHQQVRKRWARVVALGGVLCARCQRPIVPGTPWDLGHVDGSAKTVQPRHGRRDVDTARRPDGGRAPMAPSVATRRLATRVTGSSERAAVFNLL